MELSEKLQHLREVEGQLRGLGRALSKAELVRLMRQELGLAVSHSYLSQLESGTRVHLTATSRDLLARFFKVHPGYLVDDPPGYHTELTSELRTVEARLDSWLRQGAEQFAADPDLRAALLKLARLDDSRRCLVLLGRIVSAPDLVDRLMDVLAPNENAEPPTPPELSWLQ